MPLPSGLGPLGPSGPSGTAPRMTGVCLVGCNKNYVCPPLQIPGQEDTIINAHNAAPVVICEFQSGDFKILVGNESAPNFGHDACITNFEYGFSDGHKATIEILDIAGGILSKLVNNLTKNTKKASNAEYSVRFKFGWTYTDCNGYEGTLGLDFWVWAHVANLEINYTQGKIKYRIDVTDPIVTTFMMRNDGAWGGKQTKMTLEDAIRQLFDQEPKIDIKFCEKNEDGSCKEIKWKDFGIGGPKAIWRAQSLDPVNVARSWLEPFVTDKGKGIFCAWDNTKLRTLIFWADWKKKPCLPFSCDSSGINLGTFIINGGKCSNVIEFQPNFQWIQAFGSMSSGGGTAGASDGKNTLTEDDFVKCEKGQLSKKTTQPGTQGELSLSGEDIYIYAKEASKKKNQALPAHEQANRPFGSLQPITAELTIVGNPDFERYVSSPQLKRVFSIIAINPFHLKNNSSAEFCPNWLADPPCNEVLSNKNWYTLSVNHAISGGSYHTTLKAKLDVPGLDVMPGEPLGGNGSEGYVPTNV